MPRLPCGGRALRAAGRWLRSHPGLRRRHARPERMATGAHGPGTRTLTSFQVGRLAAMVRRRIEAIGDPAIRAPLPGDYLAEMHFSPFRYFDLSVDIDIGSTVLTLLAPANWTAKRCWGRASIWLRSPMPSSRHCC